MDSLDYASTGETIEIVKTVLLFVLGVAYSGYHFWLLRRGHGVAKAVWCVSGLYAASVASNIFSVFIGVLEKVIVEDDQGNPTGPHTAGLILGWLLVIVGYLVWSILLLMIAYGYDIVVPALVPQAIFWIKRTIYFAAAIPALFLVMVIALFISPSLGLFGGLLLGALLATALAYVGFFLFRFFKAIMETQGEIRVQSNLIPELRRIQFETRFKHFLLLSCGVIIVTVVSAISVIVITLYDKRAVPVAQFVDVIIGCITTIGFYVGVSYIFRATYAESLKLYGAPQPHEIGGFDSVQHQDEEIFA